MSYKKIDNFKEAFEMKVNLLTSGVDVSLDMKHSFKKKVDALYSHSSYDYDVIPQEIILYYDKK